MLPSPAAALAARLEALVKRSRSKDAKLHLGKKVSAQRLAAFEREHAIKLPADYRAFLELVGEGASGPEHGMLSLAEALEARGASIYGLADPFPAPTWAGTFVELGAGGILPISYDGCNYYQGLVLGGAERGQVWSSLEDSPGWIPTWQGTLDDERGKPFKKKGAYAALYAVALLPTNRGRRLDFAGWYGAWLDSVEGAS
jgi:hypothetical protein